jgi:membrane protease YdiL (CAAX protease family)
MNSRLPGPTGVQIAFLIFAVVFLAAPLQKYVGPWLSPAGSFERSLGRMWIFLPAIIILAAFPSLRALCVQELSRPIGRHWREVLTMSAGKALLLPFASVGGVAAWYWVTRGEMGLARWVGDWPTAADAFARATSADGIVLTFLFAVVVGPVVEELVFRAMLFRAWEGQWGWFPAMLGSSAVFAAYHSTHVSAFAASILFVVIYRRTGSLRSSIVMHATYNALLWQPLLGQWVFRKAGKETGEIEPWGVHLAALALVVVAIPAYAWLARDRYVAPAREPAFAD